MDMQTVLYAVGGAIGGAATVGGLIVWMIQRSLDAESKERLDLKKKVDTLEKEKLGELREAIRDLGKDIDEHVKSDKTSEVLAVMQRFEGTLTRMDDKLDRVCERSVGQEAQIAGMGEYVKRLDESLQNHKGDHMLHVRGGRS